VKSGTFTREENMVSSKLVTLSADGTTATVADATVGDTLSTIFSTDSAVTGLYGIGQKLAIGFAGVLYGNYRHSQSLFNFGGAAGLR